MKTLKFVLFGLPIRYILFLLLGIVLGFYLFLPFNFKGEMLCKFDSGITAISFFFGIVYLFAYAIISSFLEYVKDLFRKSKQYKIDKEVMGDLIMYYLGWIFGIILSGLFNLILFIGLGLFVLGKFLFA